MKLLGLDFGSSSVKAAVLRDGRLEGRVRRSAYPTRHEGPCVEVDPGRVLKALADVVEQVGREGRSADAIALSVMSPAWVAMDSAGKPLTPIVTHQDRRSVDEAIALQDRVGKANFLKLAGNVPVPGGISATTWAWFLRHKPADLRRADLVGHLDTFLHRHLTEARVIDPSNASFTGLYQTVTQGGWSDPLCDAAEIDPKLLPQIVLSGQIAGKITRKAAAKFGLPEGAPMFSGIVDTSAAMLLDGAKVGQLTNNCGSTDVLGLCTDRPLPHERLLTRALGVGKKWMSVSTLAAAGSAFNWIRAQFFRDLKEPAFWKLVNALAKKGGPRRRDDAGEDPAGTVRFDPYLAGERTSVEQRKAAFNGLTLSSTREQMLAAAIEALAAASAARLELFRELRVPMRTKVLLTGGGASGLADLLHRDWKGRWTFTIEDEATLRGLARLAP